MCVEIDWSEFNLNSILVHPNPHVDVNPTQREGQHMWIKLNLTVSIAKA